TAVVVFTARCGCWRSPWFDAALDVEFAVADWDRPGAAQTIEVVGADGRPVAGCRVDVAFGADRESWPPSLRALLRGPETDESDLPSPGAAPPGPDGGCVVLAVAGGPLRATAAVRGRGSARASCQQSAAVLRLSLQPAARLTGHVASARLDELRAAR